MFKDDAGKTEKPTAGRLAEAGNKGQVPLSREFTMAGSLLIAVIVIMVLGDWLMHGLQECMRYGLDVDLSQHLVEDSSLASALDEVHHVVGMVVWPLVTLFVIFVIATAISGYGQIGFKFRREALSLKLERLNPVTNLGKLVSFSSIMRTVISALKLVALASVLYFVLSARMPQFVSMYENETFAQSVGVIVDAAFDILIWIAVIVLILSVGDIAWQRFDYIRNLKMTKKEVEDERKRTDGDPLIKARLRRAAMEIAQQRMMESIPEADVVITNPTHFSVALAYDRTKNTAPKVIAKGVDDVAFEIRRIAQDHDIPLMEDPPLARALFRAVKIGEEVPEKFYRAVAAVLSQVFRMREEVA